MNNRLVLLRNRKKRIEQGHPWIYQSEVDHVEGNTKPGDIVDIVNHQGVFLAQGTVNPASQIVARVLSYDPTETIDETFFQRRIETAWRYRQRHVPHPESCRVVYGEADFLPGLVVDKYRDWLVVQMLSLGMDVRKEQILSALNAVFQPTGIYLRNDVPVRALEGLEQFKGVWTGACPTEIEIEENGVRMLVDIAEGQKTGYFFDQRENRRAIQPLMSGWQSPDGSVRGATLLDCFCHTGSFTVHALQASAHHVTAVDISETAIAMARKNVALNFGTDAGGRVRFQVANVFDYLREAEERQDRFDVVLLDPPAFVKSKRALQSAVRGYKDINLRGMKLVRDGGYLVTASCSFHMTPELFRETVLAAATDAKKILRLVHWAGAGKDHPEIAGVNEGHYLKFAIYEVRRRA